MGRAADYPDSDYAYSDYSDYTDQEEDPYADGGDKDPAPTLSSPPSLSISLSVPISLTPTRTPSHTRSLLPPLPVDPLPTLPTHDTDTQSTRLAVSPSTTTTSDTATSVGESVSQIYPLVTPYPDISVPLVPARNETDSQDMDDVTDKNVEGDISGERDSRKNGVQGGRYVPARDEDEDGDEGGVGKEGQDLQEKKPEEEEEEFFSPRSSISEHPTNPREIFQDSEFGDVNRLESTLEDLRPSDPSASEVSPEIQELNEGEESVTSSGIDKDLSTAQELTRQGSETPGSSVFQQSVDSSDPNLNTPLDLIESTKLTDRPLDMIESTEQTESEKQASVPSAQGIQEDSSNPKESEMDQVQDRETKEGIKPIVSEQLSTDPHEMGSKVISTLDRIPKESTVDDIKRASSKEPISHKEEISHEPAPHIRESTPPSSPVSRPITETEDVTHESDVFSVDSEGSNPSSDHSTPGSPRLPTGPSQILGMFL